MVSEEEIVKSNSSINKYDTWRDSFLAIQGLFYFAQGAGFVAILMIALYFQREFGVSDVDAIGYQGIFMIPWYIKIIFGVISDKYGHPKFGRRRPYILLAGILGLFAWIAFASLKTFSSLNIIFALLIAGSVAIADTVFDSLGVDITPPNRRSYMQGIGWGMRGLGGCLSGFVFGSIVANASWAIAYYIFGSVMVLGCFATLFVKEPKNREGKIPNLDIKYKEVFHEFKKKSTLTCTLFNIIGGAGLAIVSVFSTFLNVKLDISIEDVGLCFSLFALGQFVGAMIGGYLGGKFKLKNVFIGSSSLYIILIISLLLDPFKITQINLVYTIIAILGAINGGYEATQMRFSMEFSVGRLSGTMYSWYNSM
ncbi:MAG: MFS transporter, partial [Promethearchaeota archaeon]